MSEQPINPSTHHLVIIGGGFGGLYAAKALKRAPVRITLIDRRNFHLFQPLLYQVATGGLSPGNIAAPLRSIFRRQKNVRTLLGEVVDIDTRGRAVVLADGERVAYESLLVAAGVTHSYFGKDAWAEYAPGLKSVEDALEIRKRVLLAFEAAERETDPAARRAWLTFAVVGAGATGVELAGAIEELAKHTLRDNFRAIDPSQAKVLLLEGTDRVLPPYPADLSRKAQASLEKIGVEVRTGTLVTGVDGQGITVVQGGVQEVIACRTVLWSAGVKASGLSKVLQDATGVELDRAGRVMVGPDLSVPGHPEIFVAGDMAHVVDKAGNLLPGVAPVAMQAGRYVAKVITGRLTGQAVAPFRYGDKGSMATIGRAAAVADIGPLHFGGLLAWLAWIFVHLMYLVSFDNRVLVFVQWLWNYVTFNRGVRLITGNMGDPKGAEVEEKMHRIG
ncbi:MAG: NAD(P)/FAD-dependent oxidoreductase [Caldilineaceae bacterium]|nr:NAD(P)/FAD-dependent oxidoreductase [Caldilineaceae bacterium]MBP8106897.1 NAD(P)/FAD-dependent oxidoreductase [Caldilineaceae bacterium]MBP8125005.1 NAD(P)/FAD-dependent oxidoreductase [Caldilineaceae bacterium]MBP9072265.1 NAD(P)/FAD-dependent oxidoreductase [Caldilineaceae bacterium]